MNEIKKEPQLVEEVEKLKKQLKNISRFVWFLFGALTGHIIAIWLG